MKSASKRQCHGSLTVPTGFYNSGFHTCVINTLGKRLPRARGVDEDVEFPSQLVGMAKGGAHASRRFRPRCIRINQRAFYTRHLRCEVADRETDDAATKNGDTVTNSDLGIPRNIEGSLHVGGKNCTFCRQSIRDDD